MAGDKFKPRPTVYKGIEMRSRLEAGYAMWLDSMNFTWEYEPNAYASSRGQYLPDFLVRDIPLFIGSRLYRRDAFIEVKPASWTGDLDAMAQALIIVWESYSDISGLPLLILERPGFGPTMIDQSEFREPSSNGVQWTPLAWSYHVDHEDGAIVGLSFVLLDSDKPWPDGYWRVSG